MLYLRSALFLVWFLVLSVTAHIAALPLLLLPRRFTVWAARVWAIIVLFGLKTIAGLRYEVRGQRHFIHGPVLVASKHQCMWETIAFLVLLDDPVVVIKRELLDIPLYGWFARKQEMIAVDRKGGAGALRTMLAFARKAISQARPILIFPEGTRKRIGSPPDYKPGVAGLYSELDIPCLPVALNSGLYWAAGGLLKNPGRIIVEYLEPILPGLPRAEFMNVLQNRIEAATMRLIDEGKKGSGYD
ncbi:MAG: lysophospholipid acyltransferase family protein [Alphaproteobacteria bacterium]